MNLTLFEMLCHVEKVTPETPVLESRVDSILRLTPISLAISFPCLHPRKKFEFASSLFNK